MLKREFVFIVYNFVCLAIEISLDPFEKTVHNYNDLLNLGDDCRLVRYYMDNMTYHNAEIIFNKWPNVQQIVTRLNLYTITCDDNKEYIDEMDSMTLKPKRYAVNPIIGTNIKFNNYDYDVSLYRCLKQYCSFRGRSKFRLNCTNKGINKLLIKSDVQSCYKKVYDVSFQSNNIEGITRQSFMEVFIYVVRLDLRKNPILAFHYDSFKPMKLLRFLYVPYVSNVVDEGLVERLMEFNTHLLFVECTMDANVVFTAWNDYCTDSGVGFFLNYRNRGVIEPERPITERTSKVTERTRKVTERTSKVTERTSKVTKGTSKVTERTSKVTKGTSKVTERTSKVTKGTSTSITTEGTSKVTKRISKVTKRNKVSPKAAMTVANNEEDLTWFWYAFAVGIALLVVILKFC